MLLLGLVGELQSLNPDVQRNLRCLWAGSGEKEVNKKFDKEHKTYSVAFSFSFYCNSCSYNNMFNTSYNSLYKQEHVAKKNKHRCIVSLEIVMLVTIASSPRK